MNKLLPTLQKYATPRNAFIMFAVLLIVSQFLGMIDQPLLDLAHGEQKLDLLPDGYNLATVQRLFDAYGERGRMIYVWDLLVDVLYPLAQALTSILFIMFVVRKPILQKALILFPLVFLIFDLIENALFLFLIWAYPSITATWVDVASTVTSIKRFNLFISYYELFGFMLITIVILVKNLIVKIKDGFHVRTTS